jgi:(2Fe-2S) ferredoxin
LGDDGPVMIVYPEGVWYHKVKEEDVSEVVSSHLRSGRVVSRLVSNDPQAMKTAATEHREHHRAMVKARDEAGILPDDLNEMIRAFMPSRAVLTAIGMMCSPRLLMVLRGPRGPEGPGRRTSHGNAAERSAESEVARQREGTFFNTPASARFFAEGSRDNAGNGLPHTANPRHRWSTLTECVRAGTTVQLSVEETTGSQPSLQPWIARPRSSL